jgi:hypothetical protein
LRNERLGNGRWRARVEEYQKEKEERVKEME